MLGERPEYTGASKAYLANNPASTAVGKVLRQAEARKLLGKMNELEREVQSRERQLTEVVDRIKKISQEHRLNMDYLVSFGVRAEHRSQLRNLLREVQDHGALSVQESIDLTNARVRNAVQGSSNH